MTCFSIFGNKTIVKTIGVGLGILVVEFQKTC